MARRFISIWFPHLKTDWMEQRQPALQGEAFVLAAPERGRMVIKSVSAAAAGLGIAAETVVADSRAVFPALKVMDDPPQLAAALLTELAEYCIGYTPAVATDLPDGLLLDISGCAHLWGDECTYLKEILLKLNGMGYKVRAAMADTIGTAWAVARYGQGNNIIAAGEQSQALLSLPPAALRLEPGTIQKMHKLGFYRIHHFINMPHSVLRRRFGPLLPDRMAQALGEVKESVTYIQPVMPYQERLPSLEPIRSARGIEIALQQLLEKLCLRLLKDSKGLRAAVLKCYRIDGGIESVKIGTNRAVRNTAHLFKLFELKIATISPGLGIELFLLEATEVEDLIKAQESLWNAVKGYDNDAAVVHLLDRLAGKLGQDALHRYLPDEHYWPERSLKAATVLQPQGKEDWTCTLPRPVCLLPKPERIEVTAPVPDYPPMLFIYKGNIHKIKKADGPERIEQEWWLEQSLHRDYYAVEDEQGCRYWLFRLGHYGEHNPEWFIHGFFA